MISGATPEQQIETFRRIVLATAQSDLPRAHLFLKELHKLLKKDDDHDNPHLLPGVALGLLAVSDYGLHQWEPQGQDEFEKELPHFLAQFILCQNRCARFAVFTGAAKSNFGAAVKSWVRPEENGRVWDQRERAAKKVLAEVQREMKDKLNVPKIWNSGKIAVNEIVYALFGGLTMEGRMGLFVEEGMESK